MTGTIVEFVALLFVSPTEVAQDVEEVDVAILFGTLAGPVVGVIAMFVEACGVGGPEPCESTDAGGGGVLSGG